MIVDIPERGPARLPDFLIVGAMKSGTTSLYHYLRQHPQIFMPAFKEPRFFCYAGNDKETLPVLPFGDSVIYTLEDYIELFSRAEEDDLTGEASVEYLSRHERAIKNIKAIYGERYKDLKIIIILRNPVERAFSNYLFAVKLTRETLPFSEAIKPDVIERRKKEGVARDYIERGMYFQQVKAYKEEFPLTKIYLFEDLRKPERLVRDLFEFLGVAPDVKVYTEVKANPSGISKNRILTMRLTSVNFNTRLKGMLPPALTTRIIKFRESLLKHFFTKPELSPDMRRHLIRIYKDDVSDLERLVERDLSHWLEEK